MNLPLIFIAIVVLLSLGCASSPKPSKADGSRDLNGMFVDETVEKNHDDPNIIMKRAESFIEKEGYPEAVMEYQYFLQLHRGHVLAPYAQYKLGESYFKQIISVDRDPEPIYKSLEAFEQLRKDYPGNQWNAEAQKRIRVCHDYIAQASLLVGQFYYRREAYLAAAHRFEAVLEEYADLDVAGDALYYLALTYKKLGAEDWAREKLLLLAERYPNNKHNSTGQNLLTKLTRKHHTSTLAHAEDSP